VAPSDGIEIRSFGEKLTRQIFRTKMEKLDDLLAGKVKALRFTLSKTDDIVGKGNKIALERHRDALNSMVSSVARKKRLVMLLVFAG
jgi:hypothetical protein